MPTEGEDFLSGRRVPQLDGPVFAPGGQAPTVTTARQPFDPCGVSAKVEHSPRGKVPDLHFTEPRCTGARNRSTAGRGQSAVRKERHALHLAVLPRELAGFAVRILGIPDPHNPIAPARGEPTAVGAKRDSVNTGGVFPDIADLLTGLGVPERHRSS